MKRSLIQGAVHLANSMLVARKIPSFWEVAKRPIGYEVILHHEDGSVISRDIRLPRKEAMAWMLDTSARATFATLTGGLR